MTNSKHCIWSSNLFLSDNLMSKGGDVMDIDARITLSIVAELC